MKKTAVRRLFFYSVGGPSRAKRAADHIPDVSVSKIQKERELSRFLNASDMPEIEKLLSNERLSTFKKLTKTQESAIELHQSTMSLGVAISAVSGLIEVGLRNAVCHEMQAEFGAADWLRTPPPTVKWASLEHLAINKANLNAQRAQYSKLTGPEKNSLDALAFPQGVPPTIKHRKLVQKRQATLQVQEGQIVAQLSMHFWKRLFSTEYEKVLWKRVLKRVFPNKAIRRANVAEQLETIYQTRNRLAHHEPVYGTRLQTSLDAIDFVLNNLGVTRSTDEAPLAKLVLPQREILIGQVATFQSTFNRVKK